MGTVTTQDKPRLLSLSWTEDLFTFVHRALEHADEALDLDTLPRDCAASAFQAAADYLIWTNAIYGYGSSFSAIVDNITVQEARRWWKKHSSTPTSLLDPDFGKVGGLVQVAVHMVLTCMYLAALRFEAERRAQQV